MRRRGAVLEPRRQLSHVRWVETDSGAEVDGAELAALNEALDGSRMDAKERSRLLRRE